MTYQEFNIFNKYVYNKVGYQEFEEALKNQLTYADKGYVNEKWDNFKKNQLGFLANYNEELFNYFYQKMINENYKG